MLKKKQIVLAVLVAMIGLAGYFNWSYQHSDNGSVTDTEDEMLGEARLVSGENIRTTDFFAESRTERDTGRSKAKESLLEIAENPESSEESKVEAEKRLIDMAMRTEAEASCEAELKAKGFSDAVVYLNEGSATVIVKAEELTASDTVKIQEIIVRIGGVDTSSIGISSHK